LPEIRKAQRGKFTLNLTELESKTTRSLHQINHIADIQHAICGRVVQTSGGLATLLWLIGWKHCINSLVHGRDKEGGGWKEGRQNRRTKNIANIKIHFLFIS
jgi:hypothetical protein